MKMRTFLKVRNYDNTLLFCVSYASARFLFSHHHSYSESSSLSHGMHALHCMEYTHRVLKTYK